MLILWQEISGQTSRNTNAALDYGQTVVVALNAIQTTIGNITSDLQQVANLGAAYIDRANMTSDLQVGHVMGVPWVTCLGQAHFRGSGIVI